MKIGYPCINRTVGCTANSTFRLASYSEEKLIEKVTNNLNCLEKILEFNIDNKLFFFRISSDLVPFASHPICTFDWQNHFKKDFERIGELIRANDIRISMHPDQFVLINAKDPDIVKRSIADLFWHSQVLDLMKLDTFAKIQIHVGGVYGDKQAAIDRFITNYQALPEIIKRRLVIENDERLFSLKDCSYISKKTGIPIVFDSFHHTCLNNNESFGSAIKIAKASWKKHDGILMSDYSSQQPRERIGKHATHIDLDDFKAYIKATKKHDFDIMLEIKDKEKSALLASQALDTMR